MSYDKEAWRASVENGKIPSSALKEIWPQQYDPDLNGPARMHPEAALAMGALLRQAWEDGATDLRVKYSYRTYAKQLEKWANYQAGGNLAARPGTSNHGWAVAVDFTGLGPEELFWLRNKAKRYGFVNDVSSENWHYTYQEHVWGGSELTEDEKKLLNWLKGFRNETTEGLPGNDTGPAIGRQLVVAVKHADRTHVSKRHTHAPGAEGEPTGPAIEP